MENEISLLIVEDEALIARHIQSLLEGFGFTVAGVFYKYPKALAALNELTFDVLITDIDLGNGIDEKSGIQLAEQVKQQKACPVIFLTAFSDREIVKKATALMPSAYLVKPVNAANLYAAVQLAVDNFLSSKSRQLTEKPEQETPDYFFVKQGSGLVKILWADVYYLESVKNYVKIKSAQQPAAVLVRGSLKQVLQDMLPPQYEKAFVKINRSEVIARKMIVKIEKDFVETGFGKFKLGSETDRKELF